ncbi:putative pentalenene synthase [Ophiobolus disseminans]|uniref:Terpene synthase n=1 Tax=Ophiobolus disseminans TaxID=1469910 RepID=A0A6A6ZYL8_9PLEO|nr:putative pentalenene synthase [Ophiobolus disseminans]
MAFTLLSPNIPNKEDARVLITLPNLFKSFIQHEPVTRSDYKQCKMQSCNWLAQRLQLSNQATQKLEAGDFTWFAAVYMPSAPSNRFRIVSDWTNLIFYYDDLFDNGALKADPIRTQATVERLFAAVDGTITPADPCTPGLDYVDKVQAAHDDFWSRFRALASPTQRKHYHRTMVKFLRGAVQQVQDCSQEYGRSLNEIMERRRDSVGMDPCFAMICFAYDLELPDEVFEHRTIGEIEALCCEIGGLQNDVVSYRKEESEDVNHNILAVCRLQGMQTQEAHDFVGKLIDIRLERMIDLMSNLPYWGNTVDEQVEIYVAAIKNMIAANVHWSFRSQRYFGTRNEEVRKTRIIDLMVDPPYMKRALGNIAWKTTRHTSFVQNYDA